MTWLYDPPRASRSGWFRWLPSAWISVLIAPGRFFRTAIERGEQAPGLLFAVAVVLVAMLVRLAIDPAAFPVFRGQRLLSYVMVLGVVVLLVTPIALHLTAALQTVILVVSAPNRRGISETVQLIGYATAPCVFVGFSVPTITAAATLYATILLTIGNATVHGLSTSRAVAVTAAPAFLVFGLGFGGVDALLTILREWYII